MERDDAIKLANRVLNNPHLDPDGDLSVLARQFIRHVETVRSLVQAAGGHIFVSDADVMAGNDDRFVLVFDRDATGTGCDLYLQQAR
jgi:hypothetical protein